MRDLDRRALQGIRVLVGRQVVLHLFALTAGVFVARSLGPGPIGVYGIALFVVNVLALVADLGLRMALIRQPEAPTERELETCFTLQQAITAALVAALFIGAPALARIYPAATEQLTWCFRLLALDLFLRSWRTMGEIGLERNLRYREIAGTDLIASSVYHVVAVIAVLGGLGAFSLIMATLAGSLVRAALLHRASPWPLRLRIDVPAARHLVRAGLPFQLNDIVGRAPAWVTPTLVGTLIGPHAVGLLTWATAVGRKPLELLQHVTRVSLTHFARLQQDPVEVERVLFRYAVPALLACGLWFCVLAVAGEDLVRLIYTEEWLPALPVLLIFSASGMLASVRWFTTSALLALGRATFTARVTTVTAIVSVVASVLLVVRIGFVGVPIGQFLGIAIATPWLLRGLGPTTPARVLRQTVGVLVPMALAGAAGAASLQVPADSASRGLLAAAVVMVVFGAAAWWTGPHWLRARVREELAHPVVLLSRSAAP